MNFTMLLISKRYWRLESPNTNNYSPPPPPQSQGSLSNISYSLYSGVSLDPAPQPGARQVLRKYTNIYAMPLSTTLRMHVDVITNDR
jgi:hypothetical protein